MIDVIVIVICVLLKTYLFSVSIKRRHFEAVIFLVLLSTAGFCYVPVYYTHSVTVLDDWGYTFIWNASEGKILWPDTAFGMILVDLVAALVICVWGKIIKVVGLD